MPSLTLVRNDPSLVLKQIIVSPSDTDYLDQLIPSIREYSYGNKTPQLLQLMSDFADDREAEIERMCNTSHEEFVKSVNQLLRIREGTVALTKEILSLNESIQSSTEQLVEQKKILVESHGVRRNINEASYALQDCLKVLRLANQVHDLLAKKSHYAALRALDELQNVHLRGVLQYKLSDMIQRSVPATQKAIAEAVMADLSTWLYRIREMSQYLGELAFYHNDLRKTRQIERAERTPYLSHFRLNSAIELVSDEHEEYDLLNTEDLQVDFTPLLEAIHIYQSLGEMDRFRAEYASNRRKQKELLLSPTSIPVAEEGMPELYNLLEEIAGFAIVERATMKRVPDLRSVVEVDELWDSLCQTAVTLIAKALPTVDNAEHVLKIKNLVALFIQTMESCGLPTSAMNSFLLVLFDKYAELLKRRFSDDFLEIVSTDDYMPMPIQNSEEFEKVVNVSWYTPDRPLEAMTFPCVLPFSQMYPLCCIDIRNFLNQFYFFSNDDFQQPEIVDSRLRQSLDDLLSENVCSSLIDKLASQYLGQIVQILVNLEHFETACTELEQLLVTARSSTSNASVVTLAATEKFRNNKKVAEKRIFELVNMKIDDLVDTAEYDWMSASPQREPSNYVQVLTQYLSNIMNSVLLSLPDELKNLMLFNAIAHTAEKILDQPLSPAVRHISPNGVKALSIDVAFLTDFVNSLNNPILQQNLEQLQQTVALMEAENTNDYYDNQMRNKKYGLVDPLTGPILLEKLTHTVERGPADERHGVGDRFKGLNLGSRFGIH